MTFSAYSIKVTIADYSDPKDVVKWEAVPGENYVVHLYPNQSRFNEEVYFFNNSMLEVTNVCGLLSSLADQYNIRVSCGYESFSVIVFRDSTISKPELLDVISKINANVEDIEIDITLVPYESREYYIFNKLINDEDLNMKIIQELYSVFGKSKFEDEFAIGAGLYDGFFITLYAPNFTDEDITIIFKVLRKYIPEEVRITLRLYHYIPKTEPLPMLEESNTYESEQVSSNAIGLSYNQFLLLVILLVAIISVVYSTKYR